VEAQHALERSLSIQTRAYGEHHRYTAWTRVNLGAALLSSGRLDDAEAACRASLADFERQPTPDALPLVVADLCLGELELGRGHAAAALARAERAPPLLDAAAQPTWLLARALWLEGKDRGRARRLATAALAAYAKLPDAAAQRDEVASWLAARGG